VPIGDRWDPNHPAVWTERVALEGGGSRVIMVRHPTYPFPGAGTTIDLDDLRDIALAYLEKIKAIFDLPEELRRPPVGLPLSMLHLPISPKEAVVEGTSTDLRSSFWVDRYRDPSKPGRVLDRTAVFLTVQAHVMPRTRDKAIGSSLGIRIVAHVAPSPKGKWTVRFTGASCAAELASSFESGPRAYHRSVVSEFFEAFFSEDKALVGSFKKKLLEAAGVPPEEQPLAALRLWIEGFRVLDTPKATPKDRALLEVFANVLPSPHAPGAAGPPLCILVGPARALIASVAIERSHDTPKVSIGSIESSPLVAHAVRARLFRRDPPSSGGIAKVVVGRPNRSPAALEVFREDVDVPGLTEDPQGFVKLLDGQWVTVTKSRLLDKNADEKDPETVPLAVRDPRTNPFAALSGYQHGRELFDRMRWYGLRPRRYFALADLPLVVHYRATIEPGPGRDGKTVNAQVDYHPPARDLGDAGSTSTLNPVHVRFALADLQRSASRREPLGMAAEPRWSWHEYGHVLLAAATGALQLPFAHSVGDALAAIVYDPESKLAGDPPKRARLGGATFPWVYLNRRHDRSPREGWSWSGTYHRPNHFDRANRRRRRKGYQSEQILSTSLFRLYCALGGDTVAAGGAPDVRREAADYTVYLIMRAIASLGPTRAVAAETPDQFVSALIDADIATEAGWPAPPVTGVGWPRPAVSLADRVGGCAHKVVRWAFEAQGLYATTDPRVIVDAPGLSPDVDLFIDNNRPNSDGVYSRGGYMPVPLDWVPPPGTPRWHASKNALEVANGAVNVQVRNRGRRAVNDAVVSVWYIAWPLGDPQPPKWKRGKWGSLQPSQSRPKTVPEWPKGPVQFGPFRGLPTRPGRYLLLAATSCAADRANIDLATGLPCSRLPTQIVDLVAGDNNLGLRLFRVR